MQGESTCTLMGYDVQWDRVNAHVIVQESTIFVHNVPKKAR